MSTFNMDQLANRVRAQREVAGTNVHFINERGQRDCYSFATAANAARFREKLVKVGRTIL